MRRSYYTVMTDRANESTWDCAGLLGCRHATAGAALACRERARRNTGELYMPSGPIAVTRAERDGTWTRYALSDARAADLAALGATPAAGAELAELDAREAQREEAGRMTDRLEAAGYFRHERAARWARFDGDHEAAARHDALAQAAAQAA